MKTFGIKISLLILIYIGLCCLTGLKGQNCTLSSCFDEDCGPVNVGFSPNGGVRFCENTPIDFNNTSTTLDFDFFIIDWADGVIDTIYDYANVTHVYNIPDSALCDYSTGLIPFEVCFQGVKTCGTGQSCASGGYDFALLLRPRAIISANSTVCINDELSFNDLGCHGEDYLWTFSDGQTDTLANTSISFTNPDSYSVTLSTTNECGSDTDILNFNVVGEPLADASIDPLPNNGNICIGQVLTFEGNSNIWSNSTWEITPTGDNNWCFTDTLMTVNSEDISVEFKREQTYIVRLLASNVCDTDVWEEEINVLDGPTVNLVPPPSFCDMGTYTPSVTYTGMIDSYAWTFENGDPATSTMDQPGPVIYATSGNHAVTLSVQSACGELIISDTVRIDQSVAVNITSSNQYCLGSSSDTLMASPGGGTWSGTGIIDVDEGVFDPLTAGIGIHDIRYVLDPTGPCDNSANIMIEVVPSASVIANNVNICETDSTVTLTADTPGGTWDGPFITVDGVFDVSAAGVGTFPNAYSLTDANGCEVIANATVVVEPLPTLSIRDTTYLCAGGGVVDLLQSSGFTSDLSGGTYQFFIDGSMVSNPYTLGSNTGSQVLEVVYTLASCSESITSIMALVQPPTLTVNQDTALCIDELTFQLTANTIGEWSGPGVDNVGLVNLTIAGNGVHTYTFVVQEGTSCEVSEQVELDVTDPSVGLDPGLDVFVCEGTASTYQLSGFSPLGGEWSGAGVTSSGEIDLTQLVVDSIYTYTYCLEQSGFEDCSACATTMFVIRSLPQPSFTLSGGACIGEAFIIQNNTINVMDHLWDFGDGSPTSSLAEPSHTYTNRGDYTITYTAISSFGCDSTITEDIYVSEPPLASFSLNTVEGCAPLPITFTNTSSGDNISQYWVIGLDTLFAEEPQGLVLDSVTKDTVFNITLFVQNECGTVSQTEQVLVRPYPIVDIGISAENYCSPVALDFGNATVGNPQTWFWDLGNGNTSTDSIPPIQTYTTPNDSVSTYTISLLSTNMCGQGFEEISFDVYPPDVRAFIDIDTLTVCQYDSIEARSVSTPGSVLSWQIFDEGGNQLSGFDSKRTNIRFPIAGRMMVVLTARRCGADSDTVFVEVLPAPELDFDLADFGCEGDSIFAINQSIDIADAEWYVNNDLVGRDTDLSIVIDSEGVYDITLLAYSRNDGCPFQKTKQIEIIPPPTAGFVPSSTQGCSPLSIDFLNTSIGGDRYSWTVSDGSASSLEQSPSFTFIDPGIYSVSLQVFDAFGCFDDTSTINIIVHEDPISLFTTDASSYCQFYDSIRLTNESIGQVQSQWIINNQQINADSPVLAPDIAGEQEISLVTLNEHGCIDTVSQIVEILPSPIAQFLLADTSACQPLIINANNLSQQFDKQQWLLDQVETSSDFDLVFPYPDAGVVEVLLIVSNDNGCPSDTAQSYIAIHPKPSVSISSMKDSICGLPMGVDFSSSASSDVVDYNWIFSDGRTDQVMAPRMIFEEVGDIEVNLIVETAFACKDTTEAIVNIWPQPKVSIEGVLAAYCEGEVIYLTNGSTDYLESVWSIEGIGEFSETDLELIIDDAGSYDVDLLVSYNDQCKDSISLSDLLNVYTSPIALFSHEVNVDPAIKGDVLFINKSEFEDFVEWDLGDGNYSLQDSFLHEYDINRDIEVTLYAINENNGLKICIDSISKIIEPEWQTEFFAPNAFAPDYGPEEVRLFTPKGIGIEKYEIEMFSPWGKKVWGSTELVDKAPAESWNGKMNGDTNGRELPMGAYTWIAQVTFEDGRTDKFVGSVTILR